MEERDMSVGNNFLSVTKDILSRIFIILFFGLIFIAKKTGFFRKTIDKLEVDIAEEFTQRAFEEMNNGNHTFAAYFLNGIEFTLSSEHSEITDSKANSIQEIIYKKPYLDIIGEVFYEKSDYKVALIYFEHSLLFFKENTKTYYYIALCHYYLKNNNEALNFLKKANKKIKKNKEYIYFYTGEILKLIDISQEKEITESFNVALKTNPKFILPKLGLSDFYFKSEDIEKSLQYSNEYLLQYFELEFAKLKVKDGNHGISVSDIDRYNELYSNLYTFSSLNPDIGLNIEKYQDNKYSMDIKYQNNIYKEFLKNLDFKEKAILNLILAYGLNNEFDKAIFYCNKLLNINQKNVIGMIEIAHYYKLNRNYKEAEIFLNRLIPLLPEEKWIYYSLTQLYIITDRIFEIAKFSSKLERISPFYNSFIIKPIYIFQKNPLETSYAHLFTIQRLITDIINYPAEGKNADRVYSIIECLKSNYNETGMTQLELFLIMGFLNETDDDSLDTINDFFKEEKYKNKLILGLNKLIAMLKSKFDIDLIDKLVGLATITETLQIVEKLYIEFKDEVKKSNHFQVISNIGVGLRRNQNINEAYELFHPFENSENPEHFGILLNLAYLYYSDLKDSDKALAICNRLYTINPKEIKVIEFLIHIYEQLIANSSTEDATNNFKYNVLLIKYLKKGIILIEHEKEKIKYILKLATQYSKLGDNYKLIEKNKTLYSAIRCYRKV